MADNYDSKAKVDTPAMCMFAGCTDKEAKNYNMIVRKSPCRCRIPPRILPARVFLFHGGERLRANANHQPR